MKMELPRRRRRRRGRSQRRFVSVVKEDMRGRRVGVTEKDGGDEGR